LTTTTTSFDAGQRAVLESIATGASLPRVLEEIVLLIEQQSAGLLCSILLLDDNRLRHGAAPHLPTAYVRAIDGSQIGPQAGSCGTAAHTAQRVIVEDIATHPFWENYRQLAVPHGLRACWSSPILAPNGDVLGTFAIYYDVPRSPEAREIEWVDAATHLASIAIVRDRTQDELRRSESRARELARLHVVSSSINKQIVRARDPQSIYEFACRIAVQEGLAQMAWLGVIDAVEPCRLNLVAEFGYASDPTAKTVDLSAPENRDGLAYRVFRTGEVAVTGNLPAEAALRWRDSVLQRGLKSGAVFPLKVRDRVFGIFALYATQPNYFRHEELQVLVALAGDIAFAIESARKDLERQRMEEAIRASEELRTLIFSTVGDGIFYLQCEADDRYRFVSVNRAFTELFGVDEPDVVGSLLNDLLPETMRTAVLERYPRACATHTAVTWEQMVEAKTGEKHVELTIAPIFDAHGVCTNFVGTVHDVTARVQAEQERAKLVAQLNQAQRMQSLGTLAGGIAHDFNNILAAICGNVGLALQEPRLDASTQTHLLEIQKASHRAVDLVRQILTFSRHAPPKRETLDPREVVSEALNLLRATIPQTIAIETQFAAEAPRIEGDSTQLHQIVMNLCTNAAHSLQERGGVIQITVDSVRVDESSQSPGGLPEGEYLRLQVTDNGCGMNESTLKRAFDPFFTTRQPGQGTGLGLSVVHGIVQSHHGATEIRSRLNEGTTVIVYLPAAAGAIQKPATELVQRDRGGRVMYVDDEEALVFLIERALTKRGYKVSGFAEPLTALDAFRAHPDDFDVVVTDVSMPGMSGPDLAAELRKIRPRLPIIMTSGYIRPEDVETAERLQINQLVYKANTIDELGRALAKEIDQLTTQRSDAAH
jgi:two-component system cell cycle sensor histidine kinase/response regulator CckA